MVAEGERYIMTFTFCNLERMVEIVNRKVIL
jgi:hypothetical protein